MTILYGRSDFSLGQSILEPEAIAKKAKELGYEAASLVDTMSISGAIRFSNACKEHEIQPLIGCRTRIVQDPFLKEKGVPNPEFYLDLYIRNDEGFRDLCKLLTKANSEEQFYYVPRLSFDDVLSAIKGGNLVCVSSDVGSFFLRDDYAHIVEQIKAHSETSEYPGLFCRVTDVSTPVYDRVNARAREVAATYGLPMIKSRTALYDKPEDYEAKIVHSAILSNGQYKFARRPHQKNQHFAPYEPQEVEFVDGGKQLRSMVGWSWKKLPISLPKMAADEFGELVKLCKEGWGKRMGQEILGYKPDPSLHPVYKKRLAYELQALKQLGFSNYFLLVGDVVNWAKENKIMVGPGRGSVGGSLVAYLMGITDVDPIRFGLLFERFINPERIDLPDADLDFMSTRRDEVIRYLIDKYGKEKVAGISNYSYLGSASALRDVGRVMGLDHAELNPTKFVPKEHGTSYELDEAADAVPQLAEFRTKHKDIWRHAKKLSGVLRNMGKHAAGVIVSDDDICNRAVIERRSGERTICWDKRVSEDAGLVKLDVLGLSTLDILRNALDLIKQRSGTDLDLLSIRLDDTETLLAFGKGETAGVFQFESSGMRSLLKSLALAGDLTFEDLSATTSLYRPGPMDSGLMEQYVNVRQGMMPPTYDHPNMEAALKETLGVIIYQEQVMQIARDVAGYTLPESDKLRKIMGKKLPEEMAKQRGKFVDGCVAHSAMPKEQATDLFDKIEKFAGYGFNKSHAVEYSVISFWAMYLKHHYPAEFFAASMKMAEGDADKMKVLVKDAERQDLTILPPDINLSTESFEITTQADGSLALTAPLSSVKGCSSNGAREIIRARTAAGGKFTDMKSFETHIAKRLCNARVSGALKKVGAFYGVDPDDLPPLDPTRIQDQIELMPGVINRNVKATQSIKSNALIKAQIVRLVGEYRDCKKCSLCEKPHVIPRFGANAKFMVISDAPNTFEEKAGKMVEGKAAGALKKAMNEAGLSINNGYFTALVKAQKDEEGLTGAQITECGQYLKREIEALKPQVIVTLGSAAARYLMPALRGKWDELAGTVHWVPELKASVVCGFNPGMISFEPSRAKTLVDVFKRVAELVSSVS